MKTNNVGFWDWFFGSKEPKRLARPAQNPGSASDRYRIPKLKRTAPAQSNARRTSSNIE